jgi:S1-C subfamily serine protease
MWAKFIMVMLAFLVLCPAAVAKGKITEAIVKIYTTYDQHNYFRPWQMLGQRSRIGSGSIIAGNRILTNAHVVSDHTFIRVRRAGQADKFVASVAAISHELDLAILSVEDKNFFKDTQVLEIGELPSVGDKVFAYGFPKGGTRITITEGIVSRIERKLYSHSRYDNLVCQIDAAINPGSSGGPVISKGKIIGVIFQSTSGQNIGYMVPAPVIRHFFNDLADGRIDGVPTLFFVWQNLENPQMREFLGMSKNQSGVLVKEVSPAFMGDSGLMPGDVILHIDGHNVANDGTIILRETERINFGYAVDRKQVNDQVTVRVLRKRKALKLDISLNVPRTSYGYLIPRIQYETPPTYYIIGGLVFTRLTENYLNLWSKWRNVPIQLKKYYYDILTADNQQRRDVVILMDILPDKVNVGFEDFKHWVIKEVNSIKINSMRDLVDAFENNEDNYHRIVMEQHNAEIVLSKRGLEQKSLNILRKYKVIADRSADLQSP